MADIFISYARADRGKIEKLAAVLEAEGYSVWWDRHIQSGSEFSSDIERELNDAKAVIVCWSAEGVKSPWVKDEATIAARERKLKTITLDGVEPPIGYMQYHCIDLSKWRGDSSTDAFQDLARAVAAQIGDEAPPKKTTASSTISIAQKITRPALLAAIAALMFALFISAVFLMRDRGGGADRTAQEQSADASIAVLPFTDLSAEGDQRYLGDGVAEEIINLLAQIPELKVSGRTSSFSFRERGDDLRAIGAWLGVSTILEGSVQRDGDKIKITAQLISVKDGFHLWSETYEQPFADVFSVQESIARNIVQALKVRLDRLENGRLSPRGTDDMSAYIELLRGRSFFETRSADPDGHRRALEHFELAALRDPGYADALAGVGMTRVVAGHAILGLDYNENISKANDALESALRIDSEHPQAIAAMSWLQCWQRQWAECLDFAERAAARTPADPFAYYTVWRAQMLAGDYEAAFNALRRAKTLDPLNVIYEIQWGNMLIITGDIEAGINHLQGLPSNAAGNVSQLRAHGLTSALRAKDAALARQYFVQVAEAAENEPEIRQYLPIYDAALKAIEGNTQPLRALIHRLWKSGDPAAAAVPEQSFVAVEMYELAGEYDDAARVLRLLYESGDLFGPVNFGAMEWRLSPGLPFSEAFLKHPAYHEFWSLPKMAKLAEIRRANNAPWNLPAPADGDAE